MKKIFTVLVCLLFSMMSYGQLTTAASTPANLVQNVLLGAGITATNITYTGYVNSIGEFTSPAADGLGISNGLILTSGSIISDDPIDPFGFSETGPFGPPDNHQSIDVGEPGNPILDDISGNDTYDAAVLEFDFVPQSDTVKFRYTFGSEEYNDFVSETPGGVNDAFAFILSGVTTPLAPTNIALLPGTSIPVSIFTVNNGNSFDVSSGPCVNCTYYRDNYEGSINVTYDGLTTVLTARHHVICGETYHIKIMIADAGDGVYDSGVFLEAGSFSSSAPFTVASSVNGAMGVTQAMEGCDNLQISFVRPEAQATTAQSFNINVGGTANGGADYPTIPTNISFPVGVDTVTFDLSPSLDGINEGQETIIITVNNVNVCGVVTSVSYNFTIDDMTPISAIASSGTICPGDNIDITATPTGGSGTYTYTWNTGQMTPTINVSPSATTTYSVSIDDNCVGTSAIVVPTTVTVIPAFMLTIPAQPDTYCDNITSGSVIATTVPVVNGFWSGSTLITDMGNGMAVFDPSALPLGQTVLTYNAGNGNCVTTQDFTVTVNQFISSDFTLPASKCAYDAAFTVEAQSTPGNWYLNGTAVSSAVIDPPMLGAGTYQVRYETGGTVCPDATTKTIIVNPKPEVTFSAPVTEGCLVGGNVFSFNSQVTSGTATGTYTWMFGDGSSGAALPNPTHIYTVPGIYNIMLIYSDVNGCVDDTAAISYITVHPQPVPSFYASNERPSVIEPMVDFINTTPGDNTYLWSVDGISYGNELNYQHTFADLGYYAVTLTATTLFGCADSITETIQLVNDQVFYIPSAFTPNNDGKNDVFVVKSSGVDTEGIYKMQIFNRWGEKIFETGDYEEHWNGTKNNSGGAIIEGTYICKITYTDLAGKQYIRVEQLSVFK